MFWLCSAVSAVRGNGRGGTHFPWIRGATHTGTVFHQLQKKSSPIVSVHSAFLVAVWKGHFRQITPWDGFVLIKESIGNSRTSFPKFKCSRFWLLLFGTFEHGFFPAASFLGILCDCASCHWYVCSAAYWQCNCENKVKIIILI